MFFYPFGFNTAYILLVIVSLVLGLATQGYIKSTYNRWAQVPLGTNKTGAEVARSMLAANGVEGVGIAPTNTSGLDDHYDPRDNCLYLSNNNLEGASIASAAVACHEAGHAVQTAKGYWPAKARMALVPVVNFASGMWMLVFLLGIFMNLAGFVQVAIILFAFSVLFQLVTLPVEIDASRRALSYISGAGFGPEVYEGSKKVLRAAALTYVAAALVSCLQLLYLLAQTNGRR